MSILRDLFNRYNCDKGSKHNYERVYEQFFEPLKDKEINILEVGIYYGRSLQVWKEYFPKAQIYGIDTFQRIQPNEIQALSEDNIHWTTCDSTSLNCTSIVSNAFGQDTKFDIIIDDGLHTPEANAKTLKNFWPLLKRDGIYFVEDAWPFDVMKSQEIIDNGWFKNKTHIYNDFKYNMFLHELENKHVERYDLRENQKADSYIFKVTNQVTDYGG